MSSYSASNMRQTLLSPSIGNCGLSVALMLKRQKPDLTWKEVDFSSSTFWVQVHGLPSLWHDKANLLKISAKVGFVLDVDLVGDSPLVWHNFTHLRIEIDLSASLTPGFFLPRKDLTDLWITLKYERLLEICYNCGILGHDFKSCQTQQALVSNQFGFKFPVFGDWLHSDNDMVPHGIYKKPTEDLMVVEIEKA